MKVLLAALIALPILASCNTVRGIGADVEAAGKVVKETAEDAQD